MAWSAGIGGEKDGGGTQGMTGSERSTLCVSPPCSAAGGSSGTGAEGSEAAVAGAGGCDPDSAAGSDCGVEDGAAAAGRLASAGGRISRGVGGAGDTVARAAGRFAVSEPLRAAR